ncbi:DVU0298 family protein [Thermosulfurimonas sp. F29]|uniref:DVU0298 family protein n=1 Tax=Thermosulfurimonas sp. F29 TaxID=2867247 RepID=UPI001C83771B|nr:DVU0298 family protein [Thermosulfurimonas sp. F29]MBX6423558.1 HEAT repeat domain-containing protein [Thermosulfurimonas sp. F29]
MSRVRELKREVWGLLERAPDLPVLYRELERFPPRKLVSPLIGAFCHRDERVRWLAIAGLGPTVARIAREDLESARVVIRRLMWMLNEESGGMAWGAPEAMAECLFWHRGLAEEYAHILVSYLRPDGNMLEYPPAQRGVAWGIGRLAQKKREELLALEAHGYLFPLLDSPDERVRVFSAWAFSFLAPFDGAERVLAGLKHAEAPPVRIVFFDGENLREVELGVLLRDSLERLRRASPPARR